MCFKIKYNLRHLNSLILSKHFLVLNNMGITLDFCIFSTLTGMILYIFNVLQTEGKTFI